MAMVDASSSSPTCLMRSVSHPLFASCELKEGDPLRALTTSVSFGRFMTEPLDWEKWSSFSHNRTREDVKKYSRPGAVAEKKAFFEAYFNRYASKKSAKPPNKENKPPNYPPPPQTYVVSPVKYSPRQTNVSPVTIPNAPKIQSSTDDTDEIIRNIGAELEIASTRNVDEITSSTCLMEQEKTSTGLVSSPFTSIVLSEIKHVDDIVWTTSHAEHEKPNAEDIASSKDVVDQIVSSGGQMEQEKPSTENISLNDHRLQVKVSNQSSHVDKNKKRLFKDKISRPTKNEITYVRSSSRKAPVPECQPKKQIFKSNPRVSSSVNVLKKNSHVLPRPENKRSMPLLERSVNGNNIVVLNSHSTKSKPRLGHSVNENKTVVLKSHSTKSKPLLEHSVNDNKTVVLKSRSTNHSETLMVSTKKPRSVTVPSSFSFKSDERAAKRKQFFQNLEEKPKPKEQARSSNKRLHWSTAREAKPITSDGNGPINKTQKDQQKRTCPQKLGMKPKNFIEINKKMLSSSMACLPSKKSHDLH